MSKNLYFSLLLVITANLQAAESQKENRSVNVIVQGITITIPDKLMCLSTTLQNFFEHSSDNDCTLPLPHHCMAATVQNLIALIQGQLSVIALPLTELKNILRLYDFLDLQDQDLFNSIADILAKNHAYTPGMVAYDFEKKFLRRWSIKRFQDQKPVFLGALSSDGQVALIGSDDSTQVINTQSGQTILSSVCFHDHIKKGVMAGNGKTTLMCFKNRVNFIKLPMQAVLHYHLKFTSDITSVALSEGGTVMAVGLLNNIAYLGILSQEGQILDGRIVQVGAAVSLVTLSADGNIALIGSDNGTALIIDVPSGQIFKTLHFNDAVLAGALSTDGNIALIGSFDCTAKLVNVTTGSVKTFAYDSHVSSIALSRCGKIGVIGSYDGIARLIDTQSGQCINTLPFDSIVSCVAISHDGQIALAGSSNGTVRIVNVQSGEILDTLQFNDTVITGSLSADGTVAIASSHDHTAQIMLRSIPYKEMLLSYRQAQAASIMVSRALSFAP